MERSCPNCGAALDADATYCMRCGTSVGPAQPTHQPSGGPGAQPQLVDNYGQVFSLSRDINGIGSDPEGAVVVDDPDVSALHAEVRAHEGSWVLINQREPADTLVNGEAVAESHVLSNNDVISIGGTRLRFVAPAPIAAPAHPPVVAGAYPVAGAAMGGEQFRSTTDWISQPDGTPGSASSAQKRCIACGSQIPAQARVCPKCGERQTEATAVAAKKSRTTAAILALLLGAFGAHKFYLGNTGLGILYLVFCWTYIPGIVGIAEGIYYLTLSDEQFAEKYG